MVSFRVEGRPRPAGSKIAGRTSAGTTYLRDTSGREGRLWRRHVAGEALAAMITAPPLTGPLRLTLEFSLRRPLSHYGTGRNAEQLKLSARSTPTVKPDLTKLIRSVEDALTGICWEDDCQVVSQVTCKRYGTPEGVLIKVEALE